MTQLQGEGHVLVNGHVGVQSVVLENHGDIAVLGGNVVDQTVADVQFAFGDLFQTGDHTQGGGLTTAGGADQNDEFLVLDVQAELLHCHDTLVGDLQVRLLLGGLLALLLFLLLCVVAVEGVDLLYVLQGYTCHTVSTPNAPTIFACVLTDRKAIFREHYDRSPHCRTVRQTGLSSFILAVFCLLCGVDRIHLDK